MLGTILAVIHDLGECKIFFTQIARLFKFCKQTQASRPKTTTMGTPTILIILLTTSTTVHTNTTNHTNSITSTTTTRGRPVNITFAYNDCREHINPINVSTIIAYWKSSIPGQTLHLCQELLLCSLCLLSRPQ
jgi:hypothetical protein